MIDLASVKPAIGGKSNSGIVMFIASLLFAAAIYLYVKYNNEESQVIADNKKDNDSPGEGKVDIIDVKAKVVDSER